MRVSGVRAENFRAIGKLDLALEPFTVLIGPNGAGKSSVLELLNMFSGIENPSRLGEVFARWGGYPMTVRYGAPEPRMKLGFSAADETVEWDYDIALLGEGSGFYVASESLSKEVLEGGARQDYLKRDDMHVVVQTKQRRTIHQIGHTSAPNLPAQKAQFPDLEPVFELAKRVSLWPVHKFQPSQIVRGPQQLQPSKVPSIDGSNLFSAIYALKTERRSAYRVFLETLQSVVPELEDIDFVIAGAGHVSLTWVQRNVTQPFFTNQLSDGTLRMLWLATVLHTAPDDSLILLDEPEISLHPEWLMLLVSMMREASARCTVVVATQSAELVRWLEPRELVIADLTESGTMFKRASQIEDLDKWLAEFSLSELWTLGELGGRR